MRRAEDPRPDRVSRIDLSVRDGGPGTRVVRVDGELSVHTAFRFERMVVEELSAIPNLVVVDLHGLRTLDSTGVSALVRIARVAGESDIGLYLVGPSQEVAGSLRAAGVLDLFEIEG